MNFGSTDSELAINIVMVGLKKSLFKTSLMEKIIKSMPELLDIIQSFISIEESGMPECILYYEDSDRHQTRQPLPAIGRAPTAVQRSSKHMRWERFDQRTPPVQPWYHQPPRDPRMLHQPNSFHQQ